MTNILFWNLKKSQAAPYLGEICEEQSIDLAILAEASLDNLSLSNYFNKFRKDNFFIEYSPVPSRIRYFTNNLPSSLSLLIDGDGYSARSYKPIVGAPLNVFSVHLPSKLYSAELDQYHIACELRALVEDVEARAGIMNTLIIGDFNMAPYELGMVAANGFHGVMDKDILKRGKRTYRGRDYNFFYNPMWSLIGDTSIGPPGTYFANRSDLTNTYWRIFDQVLLRSDLLPFYRGVHVVARIGAKSLLKDGRVDTAVSDHLPIVVKFS